LIKKRFFIPETGEWVTLKVATSTLRTINKLGIYEYLKEAQRKGMNVGVKLK
jgi:large subunit ribosomal protein L28